MLSGGKFSAPTGKVPDYYLDVTYSSASTGKSVSFR